MYVFDKLQPRENVTGGTVGSARIALSRKYIRNSTLKSDVVKRCGIFDKVDLIDEIKS